MTDRPGSPHLDDETISALVDGEAGPDAAAHATGCDRCAGRLAAFRAVAEMVATPVAAPADAERDRAVQVAVAALTEPAAPAGAPSGEVAVFPWWRRRWVLPAAAAVLAVVVGAGVAIPLAGDGSGGSDPGIVAAPEATGGSDAGSAGAAMAATAYEQLGPLTRASLPGAVRDRLRAAPAPQPPAGSDTGGGAGPLAGTGPAEERTGAGAATGEVAQDGPGTPCEAEVRSADPSLGPLALVAEADFESTPAFVLAFRPEDAPEADVYVTAREGCRVLHVERVPVER